MPNRVIARLRRTARMFGQAAWHAFLSFYQSDDLTFATSIAFYALLSLFPFFLLLLSLLGNFAADAADRATVLSFVLTYLPDHLDFMTAQLDGMRESRFRLGIAGIGLMIWASLGVFGALTSAVDHAWGVDRHRSFFKHKLVSFSMLVAASGLLLFVMLLVSTVGVVESSRFGALVSQIPAVVAFRRLAVRSSATVLLIVVVGLIVYFVPNAKVRFRDVWMGAALTGILWRLALEGFQWYARDLTRLTVIHGSITAVVVFLVWIYVSAVILLYGVEFTAAYARVRRHLSDDAPAAPSPRV